MVCAVFATFVTAALFATFSTFPTFSNFPTLGFPLCSLCSLYPASDNPPFTASSFPADHQINGDPSLNIKIQWATLGDYFAAVHKSHNTPFGQRMTKMPSLSGDFFSYADRADNYWTGYFTTRPFYKHLDRVLEGRLRAAEIMHTLVLAGRVRGTVTIRNLEKRGTHASTSGDKRVMDVTLWNTTCCYRDQTLERRGGDEDKEVAAVLRSGVFCQLTVLPSSFSYRFQADGQFGPDLAVARQNLGLFQHHDGALPDHDALCFHD